eukprot:CAMPEP_0183732710 /NCGR_PEP_ID=MMETSP0737-20130205/39157_1 /TAXON_ID=385413 /ORGANISM="Thalassiosira miniscula, Strain CCMP1093" /LENGTH=402 /DNA_ID=CAMNT_0025965791 /DNA_START=203 /DNA_END=1411 /DNA_ORIENTATION=+
MKFCRNLQRVIDITDPEWAPYWTNYKMLKKFLKALVPPDAMESHGADEDGQELQQIGSLNSDISEHCCGASYNIQHHESYEDKATTPAASRADSNVGPSSAAQMSRNPGEVAFFKLLNSELKKAIHFFDKAQVEIGIRECRVREGIDIMRKTNSLMVNEKWSLMAKSLYRLYKDLLLLETYAIMTYCSFSKILKKHDKVTKHNTRIAFMKNVVNKANFTHYPKLLEMINRCERLYEEVSQSLVMEGKSGLYEDERLFINMIHRLNEQVLGTAEVEGAPGLEGKKGQRRSSLTPGMGEEQSPAVSSRSSISSHSQVDTLRALVEENAMNKSSKDGLARVSESDQAISTMVDREKLPSCEDSKEKAAVVPKLTTSEDMEGEKRPHSADSKGEVQPIVKRARPEQ